MARTPLRPDDPAGIGRYRLLARLGAGGMGVVYLGAAADGSYVAVKVLRPELADDPEFRRRFSREVSALGRVRGECTVRVIEADTEAARPFMVTEYAEGPSLAEYMDRYGNLGPEMLFGLATGLAEALAAIHAAGIVHRDLKPSNIILTRRGPKVIDFGIAQALDAVSMTRTGMMVGSPGFMAPEQVSGHPGQAADVFVWGVTIAYAALGQSPFGTGDTNAVLYRVLYETPDLAAVPGRLRPLVQAALTKDPQFRPTAPQLLSQLTRISRLPARPSQDTPTQAILAETWMHTPPSSGAPTSGPRPAPVPASGSALLEPAPSQPGRPRSRKVQIARLATFITVPAVVIAAVVVLAVRPSGHTGSGHSAADQLTTPAAASLPVYAGQQQRGVSQDIERIVASGRTMVTTGSQISDGITRQQFFVSTDGGKTWRLATTRTAGGGPPALGLTASRIAAGPHGWVALGSNAIWTSPDGQSWTLAATHGLPTQPGDQVLVANGTPGGFLAGGVTGANTAVIWTSSNGVSWQRTTATQLGLRSASGGTPTNISFATASSHAALISDGTSAWLNTGGPAWTAVSIPADHGAQASITGVAADGSGLLAARPGAGRAGAVAYYSADGHTWQYAGTIGSSGSWSQYLVKGSNDGFVVAGTVAGQLVAYTSTGTGGSWRATSPLGSAGAGMLSGVTVAPGGTVVAVGTTPGKQAFFTEADGSGTHPVPVTAIPGGLVPEVRVASTAVFGQDQVAVGSADGYPAIWHRVAGGSWKLVTPLSLVSGGSGAASLSSVTHGSAGWLAVGAPGIAFSSADGVTWRPDQAAAGHLSGAVSAEAVASGAGYVIVGAKLKPTSGCLPIVWWSQNLTSWTKGSDVADADDSSVVLTAAAGPAGFVSGGAYNSKPAVWTSADGRVWKTIMLPYPAGDRNAQVSQIAVSGSRVVGLGQQTTAGGQAEPLAELSTDLGKSWHMVPFGSIGAGTAVTALTTRAGRFTAAGLFGSAGQHSAAVWTSADGTTWTRSAVSGLAGGGDHDITTLTPASAGVSGIDSVQGPSAQAFVTLSLG